MPVISSLSNWTPINPRLSTRSGKGSLYRYYAGFCPEFVTDALRHAQVGIGKLVLDPWNGSGTTTASARELGSIAYGFDRNPAMTVVAKANLLSADVGPSLSALAAEICMRFRKRRKHEPLVSDGLCQWLSNRATSSVRRLEREVHRLLVGCEADWPLSRCDNFSGVSSLASFFYVALFRVVRQQLRSFSCTNPTWIRKAGKGLPPVALPSEVLLDAFMTEVEAMRLVLRDKTPQAYWSLTALETASSTCLPLMDGVVDVVVTSPPYCTRIDYVMASAPELAVLGFSGAQYRHLRDQMIGTLTVTSASVEERETWGQTCLAFLESVRTHGSRASNTYYFRTHVQYFHGMWSSLEEIARVLRPGGVCIMVVQDSYYKEVRNDVATIISEMAAGLGLEQRKRTDFIKRATLAGVNPRSRGYRASGEARESVVAFQKTG